MKIKNNTYLKCIFLALTIFCYGCGSGSSGNDPENYIPPFIDPNGGPVLKLDIGTNTTSKKAKTNLFLKDHAQSVAAYSTDGTLLSQATRIKKGLWQLQLPDNKSTIVKAIIANSSGGKIRLELLLASPVTGTYEINDKTTETVGMAYILSYLEGLGLELEPSFTNLEAKAQLLLTDINNDNFLKEAINKINASSSATEAVDEGAIHTKELFAIKSLLSVIRSRNLGIESGAVKADIEGIATSQFKVNGSLNLILISSLLKINEFNNLVNLVNSLLLIVEIQGDDIKLTSKTNNSVTQLVSFPLTNNDISEIQSFFRIPNTPPTITSVPLTVGVQDQLYSYTITTNDDENDDISLSIKTGPGWLSITNNILSGIPTSDDLTDHNVILEATDNINAIPAQQSFIITVTATASANNTPVIKSGPPTTATVGILYTYIIFATDADNDTLSYSASTFPSWLSFDTNTHELSGTPKIADIATHDIQLDVSDGKIVVPHIYQIIVSDVAPNLPPVFDAVNDTSITQDIAFSLTIIATDPDGDTVTLAPKLIPNWLTFSATTGVLSGTPTSNDAGDHTVTVTASDGINSPPTELSFSIKVNTIPAFTSTPIETAIVNSAYTYNVIATDPDGDTVTISTTTKPDWLTYTATGSVLNGLPAESDIGVHDVELLATDNTSVATGKQTFQVMVLSNLFIGTVDSKEITDGQTVLFGNEDIVLGIGPRDTNNTSLTFNIKIDGTEQTLTNNTFTLTPVKDSYTVVFTAIETNQVEKTLTITLKQDKDHLVLISFTGETAITGGYRKIPGAITFSAAFQGLVTDTIISRTIQLDDIPQSLNSNNQYIMDPTITTSGAHKIKATISYTDSENATQTSTTTIDFDLIDNNPPTQTVKIDSLVITSDTALTLHSGNTVTVTTENHLDADGDTITKGLYLNNVLNSDLTQYVVDIADNETLIIKTYLKDPYDESTAYTLTFTSSANNGGIPVSLSATGTVLTSTTTYRDKVNGQANFATITSNLGTDAEGDNLASVAWYVNNVLLTSEASTSLILDLSTYGGTTVNVEARITDDFVSSPTTTTASINLVVDLDNAPSFSSVTLDGSTIGITASIAVDHSSNTNKIYIPTATDPEGDSFTFKYNLSNATTTGSQFSIPFDTLNGSTLTVSVVQFDQDVATTTHNVTASNIVPTPIIIGNTSHIDLNGNYSLIVRPGEDIEGDKLTTVVTLNNNPIAGVVVNNEIQYSVDLTALGGNTAVFKAVNTDDNGATPTQVIFNVIVIKSLPPTNIKAVRGNTTVTLSWDAVTSASSYNIYHGTNPIITLGATQIANVSSPYIVPGLANGTTNYFRITANHTSAEGDLSPADIIMTPHAAGDTLTVTVNAQAFVFKYIPAGSFVRGSSSTETGHATIEAPSHTVTISKEFWMLETEVSQDQWNAIVTTPLPNTAAANPSNFVGGTLPVEQVTWEDATGTDSFISRLHLADVGTVLTTGLYLLPTEAQWEYAYRAGTTTRFHWGDDLTLTNIATYTWYTSNATSTTNPVGSKTANSWGLKDMSGNVSEWCLDKAPSAYISSSVTDPTGPTTGVERIFRGGSWFEAANQCRAAQRFQASKDIKGTNLGFRFIRIPLDSE